MKHLISLLIILFVAWIILIGSVVDPTGKGTDTQTQITIGNGEVYFGPPGLGPEPYDTQPCNKANHGQLSPSGRWICIENGRSPGTYRWRPWPEPTATRSR